MTRTDKVRIERDDLFTLIGIVMSRVEDIEKGETRRAALGVEPSAHLATAVEKHRAMLDRLMKAAGAK